MSPLRCVFLQCFLGGILVNWLFGGVGEWGVLFLGASTSVEKKGTMAANPEAGTLPRAVFQFVTKIREQRQLLMCGFFIYCFSFWFLCVSKLKSPRRPALRYTTKFFHPPNPNSVSPQFFRTSFLCLPPKIMAEPPPAQQNRRAQPGRPFAPVRFLILCSLVFWLGWSVINWL